MSAPQEIELKLECDGADMPALAGHPLLRSESGTVEFLETTYFDTPGRALHAAGLSLRLRRNGARTVQTLKAAAPAAAGLFARPEWEWPVDGPGLDLALLDGTPAQAVLAGPEAEPQPLFRTVVERTLRPIDYGGARIDATLDAVRVETDRGDLPFYELELELREGRPGDLFALGRDLSGTAALRLGVLTKSERGYALIEDRLRRPSKARPVVLDPDVTAGAAFAGIGQGCLRHLCLNEAVFLHGADPEALHQMRVALRRLRSAFTLFKPLWRADPAAEPLRAEIKRVTAPFGTARNLDVFLDETLAGEIARRPDEPGLHDLRRRLVEDRDRAHAAVRDIVTGGTWRRLVIDLAGWLAVGAWRGGEDGAPAAPDRDRPAEAYAAEVLDRLRRRVRKRGRDLADLAPEDRHRVRIEAKKLRYGAEFFAPLFTGKKAARRQRALVEALSELQDGLGALNDLATARAIADRLTATGDGADAPSGASLFAAGLTAAHAETRAEGLLADAEKAHRRFDDVKPFWR